MSNTGHGHVRPRDDGHRARCGGPGMCPLCSQEAAQRTDPAPNLPDFTDAQMLDYVLPIVANYAPATSEREDDYDARVQLIFLQAVAGAKGRDAIRRAMALHQLAHPDWKP
jgi:hypothetical protein